MLVLYPETLLNSLISSNIFGEVFSVSYVLDHVMCRDRFTFSFLIWLPFVSCYYLIALAKKHKLESGLLGEASITSDMQMTPPLWEKVKRN